MRSFAASPFLLRLQQTSMLNLQYILGIMSSAHITPRLSSKEALTTDLHLPNPSPMVLAMHQFYATNIVTKIQGLDVLQYLRMIGLTRGISSTDGRDSITGLFRWRFGQLVLMLLSRRHTSTIFLWLSQSFFRYDWLRPSRSCVKRCCVGISAKCPRMQLELPSFNWRMFKWIWLMRKRRGMHLSYMSSLW